jgi:DNA repair protein RecN (Recombination protein N)
VLKQLFIRNYAIIDEITISFKKGLTIITGETGAGKSILMGALSKILGERADSQSLLNANEKCIIEGIFDIETNHEAQTFLQENEFDASNELIIRREITSNGKSRIFINDTPTTLSFLTPLANLLIDLHRQFDTIELQNAQHQLQMVDEIAQHSNTLQHYKEQFQACKKWQQALIQLQEKNRLIKQELDYNQFLFSELEAIKLQPNEIENIEIELTILQNSDALKQSLGKASMLLNESDESIVIQLKNVINSLETQAKNIPDLQTIVERLTSSYIEIKDITSEVDDLFSSTHYDEEKINLLTDRLNEANRLLKKHHVQNTHSLIEIMQSLEEKIQQATTADEDELAIQKSIETHKKEVEQLATQLTDKRKAQFLNIENKVNELLQKVGMPNATLKVQYTETDYSTTGKDKVEFMFDANKTGKFQPIHKAASGGELSRLMLCLKSIIAGSNNMPTLIFDEIDTGISGEVALQVGNIMKELATQHQLISITHLPQIAGKASQHLYIYKQENKAGNIYTRIKELTTDERVEVLAEMMSGKDSSQQTKDIVRELMK